MIHEWEEKKAKGKRGKQKSLGEWRWRSKCVAESVDEEIFYLR